MTVGLVGVLAGCASVPVLPREPTVLEPGVPWTVPDRDLWATDAWPRATPEEVGLDPSALDALIAYSLDRDGDDVTRRGQRTNALVIVRHGKLVAEAYARGTTAETPLLTWSVTKSFGSTLVGAAVQEGLVHPDDLACAHYRPLCGDGKDAIRLGDLLQMSSGLAWDESYETSPIFSSVMAMLYTRGHRDMAAFAAAQPLVAPPGTRWVYSSGDSNLASAVLRQPLGARYDGFPREALIEPLGMSTAVYEKDPSGTFVASSYLYASAPDVARWAQLVLDDGVWQGERLLAPGWVRWSTSLAPAFTTTPVGHEHRSSNPGAQWYVNVGDPDRDLERPWPALPPDAFGATGHWGKFVWVVPSWDLIVVRLGDDREYACTHPDQPDCVGDPASAFSKPRFLELLASAVRDR